MEKTYMVVLVPMPCPCPEKWSVAVARVRAYVKATSSKEARLIAEVAMSSECDLPMKAQYSRCLEGDEKGMADFNDFTERYGINDVKQELIIIS